MSDPFSVSGSTKAFSVINKRCVKNPTRDQANRELLAVSVVLLSFMLASLHESFRGEAAVIAQGNDVAAAIEADPCHERPHQ